MALRVLTRTQAGSQCPGSSSKRCQRLSSKHVTRDKLDFLGQSEKKLVLELVDELYRNAMPVKDLKL